MDDMKTLILLQDYAGAFVIDGFALSLRRFLQGLRTKKLKIWLYKQAL
jgi:hypothetical protein